MQASRFMSQVHNDLVHRVAGLPYINGVAFLGALGQLVNVSHTWPVPNVNVADRDFFQALTSDPTGTSFISAPTKNRTNGAWSVLLSRAFRDTDGRLMGVVNVAMELASFERFFAAISLAMTRRSVCSAVTGCYWRAILT